MYLLAKQFAHNYLGKEFLRNWHILRPQCFLSLTGQQVLKKPMADISQMMYTHFNFTPASVVLFEYILKQENVLCFCK